MSIILKGINMPKDIDELRLIINGMSIAIEPTQAIQIPTPHGRLIDASELDKCWEEKEDISEDVDYKILYKCVLAISKYAPTILDEEGK